MTDDDCGLGSHPTDRRPPGKSGLGPAPRWLSCASLPHDDSVKE